MIRTDPLDLHEIRSRIASHLDPQDVASCARVSRDWNDSFSPRLFHSVVLSKDGPTMESVNKNKRLIRHLTIEIDKLDLCDRKEFAGSKVERCNLTVHSSINSIMSF